jgi:hypothetical protein
MESAPETDPLRRFLSGKRRSERQSCDLPVEVRGSGMSFTGRAIDVSEGGVLVWLDPTSLAAVHPEMGMIEAMGVVDRYFRHGAQVVFASKSLHLPCTVVRLTPPRAGGGIHLGCRFERALTADEGARLLATAAPAPLAPLALAPKPGPEIYALFFPADSVAAGPRYVARLTGLSDADAEARIEPPRPTPAADVADELAKGRILARCVRGGETIWQGEVRVVSVRPAISRTPAVDVRFSSADGPFPPAVRKRFAKRRG